LLVICEQFFAEIKMRVCSRQLIGQHLQLFFAIFPFHNFEFAPVKNFVEKKSHRLLLREAVQQAGQPAPSGATSL
jgi:hypothetical protein